MEMCRKIIGCFLSQNNASNKEIHIALASSADTYIVHILMSIPYAVKKNIVFLDFDYQIFHMDPLNEA